MKLKAKKNMRLILKFIFSAALLLVSSYCFADTNPLENPKMALAPHNTLRALHQAPSLVWDDTLAAYAKTHATNCRFQHSGGQYGENLAAGYHSISDAVYAWYAEKANYSFQNPGFSMKTGHFTQVVWKKTTKIGCAYVPCNGENGTPGNFLVCEYNPPGNITNPGYFEANVLPQ
jgi:hypothetical protein